MDGDTLRTRWRDARRPAAVAGGLVLVYLVVQLAAGDRPYGGEHDVVDAATRIPDVVGWPMRALMELANRALVPLYALLAWRLTRKPPAALAVLIAGWASVVGPLKDWAERPRPTGVRLRDHVDGYGFPSGHTAFAFAVAAVIAAYLPGRWRLVPYGLAAAVGLARMHVGVHHPTDVLGGALWGTAVAYAALTLVALALPDEPPPG
jgi:membrane-associated phospholipid phosphatase